jgi:peptidoglycan/xylan/chitin deacetylase (PgdA/CDA1 family)
MSGGNALTVVTYHFVRAGGSRFPGLKALAPPAFSDQLAYLRRHYRIVSMETCLAAARGERLPERALLLTFDDAYAEHYGYVFPLLRRERIPAAFFPPAAAVERRRVLEPNRIHFLLASRVGLTALLAGVLDELEAHRERWQLLSTPEYWRRLGQPYRWDGAAVVFLKRLLQRELPRELRQEITGRLFRRYVTADEASFARELYLGEEQLREMVQDGMYVGSHGYEHPWMDTIGPAEQQVEIDRSLALLRRIGIPTDAWAIAYPFGACDASLLEIVRARGAVLGFTSAPGVGHLGVTPPLQLPRMDTNDLPRG